MLGDLRPLKINSRVWADLGSKKIQELTYGSEDDIRSHVRNVIKDAIETVGLIDEIEYQSELGVLGLQPDVWALQIGGFPVGVVEVQKPGKNIMEKNVVHGQIYDYMLRLKSFFGLESVFGIVTCYQHWRVYWLEGSEKLAEATTVKSISVQKFSLPTKHRYIPADIQLATDSVELLSPRYKVKRQLYASQSYS